MRVTTPKEYIAAAEKQGCIVKILDDTLLRIGSNSVKPRYLVVNPATGRTAYVPLPHPSQLDEPLSEHIIETWNRRLGLDI